MASRPRTPKPKTPAEVPAVPEAAMAITLPSDVAEKLEQIERAAQEDRATPPAVAEGIVSEEWIASRVAAITAPPAPASDDPLPPPSWTVIVTGPKAGRRRAGRAFGPEPVPINSMDLTEDEIAALQADPALTVEIIDAPY